MYFTIFICISHMIQTFTGWGCHFSGFLVTSVFMPCRNEASYITMLAPFLRYLYCEPQRQPQHAVLRQSLLRVLLPAQIREASAPEDELQRQTSAASDSLLLCLCELLPHMQVWDGPCIQINMFLFIHSFCKVEN